MYITHDKTQTTEQYVLSLPNFSYIRLDKLNLHIYTRNIRILFNKNCNNRHMIIKENYILVFTKTHTCHIIR
jgi:hypothetical protein